MRRELWENRSIYIAPLAVAAVALFAFSLSAIAGHLGKGAAARSGAIARSAAAYDLAAGLMMLTGIVVSVFYCLDALHSERRDRSILFWKSLPVSDLTTVLAKVSIPLVVLPLLIFAITVAMQWIMLLLSSAVLLASGQSVATLWTKLPFFRMSWLLALSHSHGPCALARAHLLLAAACLRMVTPRDISMGGLACWSRLPGSSRLSSTPGISLVWWGADCWAPHPPSLRHRQTCSQRIP